MIKRNQRWIFLTVGALIGLWAVTQLVNAGGTLLSEIQKLTAVMKLIETAYVEKPDLEILTEGAIEGMLKRLDPHSVYIPAKEQEEIAEKDRGEFEGIGISFVIQNEWITVISPITGTPAERLGLRAGDRIIEIDSVSAFGITNEEVFKKLRGKRGTTVNIKVAREGVPELLEFTIVRDKIPIHSVWTSFMLDDSTGYILLNQFTATTSTELTEALSQLEKKGLRRLIFDLRNNQGGRLSEAVSVADMFIPGRHPIVSRRGRNSDEDTTYYSTSPATHPLFNLIVLINGGSASASEIVAGAVQDLDRGLIVGKNSFGKGLVQYPYTMRDGGVIRLSVAHYYTPSGRLIQRSYEQGRGEYYASRSKVKAASDTTREVFHTLSGRKVYSGSGIIPDEEIDEGTYTFATARLVSSRLLFEFAEKLVQKYAFKPDIDFRSFQQDWTPSEEDLEDLIALAQKKDISYSREALDKDKKFILTQIKAEIAQFLWNDRDHYYMIRIGDDEVVSKALTLFDQSREVAASWWKPRKG
ncbi:MAG: S41 family peptidase [Calditrichota bacterium]